MKSLTSIEKIKQGVINGKIRIAVSEYFIKRMVPNGSVSRHYGNGLPGCERLRETGNEELLG